MIYLVLIRKLNITKTVKVEHTYLVNCGITFVTKIFFCLRGCNNPYEDEITLCDMGKYHPSWNNAIFNGTSGVGYVICNNSVCLCTQVINE